MNLVDEYLRAVALLLPKDQRDDIIAELRDVILSRTEAREAELHRPLTDDELEAGLREIGHPLVVAARYRGGPQHVVGPALYPYWIFGVKVAVTIQLVFSALLFLARGLSGGDLGRALGEATGQTLTGIATLVGIATIAAWIIERQGVKIGYLDHWRVRDLRGLELAAWDFDIWRDRLRPAMAVAGQVRPPRPHRIGGPRSRAGRALGMVASATVFCLWWVGALYFPLALDASEVRDLGVDPGALAAVDWAGLRATLFWPVLALSLVPIAQGVFILMRPDAVRIQGAFNLLVGAGFLALAAWLWTASPLAPAIGAENPAQFVHRLKAMGGQGSPTYLAPLIMLVVAIVGVSSVFRMLRGMWALAAGGRDDGRGAAGLA